MRSPRQFVVVENPGMHNEHEVGAFSTQHEAQSWISRHYNDGDPDTDIMLRQPDGTLTTEF